MDCKTHSKRKIKNHASRQTRMATGLSFGGDEGDRTPDLLNAIQALSQLSYAPKSFTNDIIRKNTPFVNSFLLMHECFYFLIIPDLLNSIQALIINLPSQGFHPVVQRFVLCPGNIFPFRINKALIRCFNFFVFLVCLIGTDNLILTGSVV